MFSDAYLPDINGVVSSIATLKMALEKMGHTVFVISNHKGFEIDYDKDNRILRLPGLEMKKMYGYKMSGPIQISGEEYVRNMHLDVIHVHTEAGIGLFARQVAKRNHIPVVYTYHTMYEEYMHYVNPHNLDTVNHYGKKVVRFFSKLAANGPQAVIAPSDKTKKALQSYGVITPIYIVPTGLDFHSFDPETLDMTQVEKIRTQLHIQPSDHTVIFLGRIAKEKCIEMPIEAMTLTKDEHLKLIVVGGGTDEKYYQDLAKKYGVEDRVLFTGRVDKSQVPYYYAAFDCFVSASTTETQGMTYLEALASKRIVFGRRDEVLKGLVDEDSTGYYFDDAQELAQKLDTYFSKSIDERKAMGQACLTKTDPYDIGLFGQKVLAVYNQAIDDYMLAYMIEKITFVDGGFVQMNIRRKRSNAQIKKLLIPEEDFFELKLAVHTLMDGYLVENYESLQAVYKALQRVKRKLALGDYSKHEIRMYCRRKCDLNEEDCQTVIDTLVKARLLDDRAYAFDKAELWHAYGLSRTQISNKLWKAGIDASLIQEAIEPLNLDMERNNALEMAKRLAGSVRLESSKVVRQNIMNKLIAKGYSYDVAKYARDAVEIERDEDEILIQTVKKAERLYKNKEDGVRYQKIRQYCMRKGFTISQIDEALEWMEKDD